MLGCVTDLTSYDFAVFSNHHVSFGCRFSSFIVTKKNFDLCSGIGDMETENYNYCKIASSRLSWLVALIRIFRRLMNGKFDAYVL